MVSTLLNIHSFMIPSPPLSQVRLSADVALGCCFLIVYNGVMLALGLTTGTLPKRFYLFARAWYCLYFVLACLLGFHLLDGILPWGS